MQPFILARTWSTLDHATKGRIAWNVVTSYSNTSAQANGLDKIVAHDKRYEKAYEYLDLCYAYVTLLESTIVVPNKFQAMGRLLGGRIGAV